MEHHILEIRNLTYFTPFLVFLISGGYLIFNPDNSRSAKAAEKKKISTETYSYIIGGLDWCIAAAFLFAVFAQNLEMPLLYIGSAILIIAGGAAALWFDKKQ